MRSLFVVLAWLCCGVTFAQGVEPIWPTQGWQTSIPEEQGMDSATLAGLVAFGKMRSFDSVLLVRHGRIVLETYYAPYSGDTPHAINSATKSVMGSLIGIALKDGLLDRLDRPVLDFFHDRPIENVDERKKAITIQHLLDMTSGIDWHDPLTGRPETFFEMMHSPDWIGFTLDRPMSNAPGETFNYNTGNSQLLSAIITKLTGMNARDYAQARLFTPLGISNANWPRDPQGHATGGFGMAMLPRDMAKIGYLYLRNGAWEDKRILSPAWIDKVSHAVVDMKLPGAPDLRYSNSFWALPSKQVYMAVGYHCQLIMVFHELDIVAVTTARDFCPFGTLADLVSRAVKSETALPPDTAGADLLALAIRHAAGEKPAEAGSMNPR
jgi:CubicO group peptidase (beta-lactamase class C family)